VAGSRPFNTGAGSDLEISLAAFNRAFTSEVTVFIDAQRNIELVTEPLEVIRVESAHNPIHAASPGNVKRSLEEIYRDGNSSGTFPTTAIALIKVAYLD
jgi:hypothetical protein